MLYYLQLSKVFTGNCVMWWRKGGGYTSNIREAETFTKEEAYKQNKARNTDIPWPTEYINEKTQLTVDHQYIDMNEAKKLYERL